MTIWNHGYKLQNSERFKAIPNPKFRINNLVIREKQNKGCH